MSDDGTAGRPDDGMDDRLEDRLDLDEDVTTGASADVRPPGEHASELPGDDGNAGGVAPESEQVENAESSEDQPSQ